MSASRQLCSATLSRRPVDVHEWRVIAFEPFGHGEDLEESFGRIGYSSS